MPSTSVINEYYAKKRRRIIFIINKFFSSKILKNRLILLAAGMLFIVSCGLKKPFHIVKVNNTRNSFRYDL